MAIDWTTLEEALAQKLADDFSDQQTKDLGGLPAPASTISGTVTWDGTATVLATNTSEISSSPASYVRKDAAGSWFKVTAVTPNTSFVVEDTYKAGSFPSGVGGETSQQTIPAPPSSSSLKTKMGDVIAAAVREFVEGALDEAVVSDVTSGVDTVGPNVIS